MTPERARRGLRLFVPERRPADESGARGGHRRCRSELAKIVRAADTKDKPSAPEGGGLEAIADGFRQISKDGHENMAMQFVVYDALHACC